MPVPEGNITTTQLLLPVVEEADEHSTTAEEADPSTPEQG